MVVIEIPKVEFNPFVVKPVQSEQGYLFHGRERDLSILSNMIKHRSPRLCVIHGKEGIGKTSFLNILSNSSSMPVIIDSLQGDDYYQSALEGMYSAMIGYEIPTHWRQIEHDLVNVTKSYTGSLPIVAIDGPDLPINELTRLIGRFSSLCKKLDVLAVFSLNSSIYQELPLEAKKHFGIQMKFDRLEDKDISAMIVSRMKTVGVEWSPSQAVVAKVSSEFNGNPGHILSKLRDIVDKDIFEFSTDAVAIDELVSTSKHAIDEAEDHDFEAQFSDFDKIEDLEVIEKELTSDEDEEIVEQLVYSSPSTEFYSSEGGDETDSIDSDEQVGEVFSSVESENKGFEYPFNLDFDELSKLKNNEVAEQEIPIQPPIQTPVKNMPSGGLSGLVSRMKSSKTDDILMKDMDEVDSNNATAIWVSPNAPLVEDALKQTETESTMPQPDLSENLEMFMQEDIEENHLDDYPEGFDQQPVSIGQLDSSLLDKIDSRQLIRFLSDVLSNQQQLDSNTEVEKIVKAILKYNQPEEKLEYEQPLNIEVFTRLNEKEARVLALGLEKEITPSDLEILNELEVKRPRLSQICNKLQKNGVFRSKKIGRSRFFSVTSTAKAQMRAWGMLESGGDF